MKQFIGFYLALMLVPVAVRAVELTNADAVLKFALVKNASYDSFSAALTENVNLPAKKMQLTGTIAFKRPVQMRLETTNAMQHTLMVIGTDSVMWQEVIVGGQTRVMKMDWQNAPTNSPAAVMLKESFSRLDPQVQLAKACERYAFTLLPATELHGQRMYVLVGELRPELKLAQQQGPVFVSNGKYFVGQQDGFMHRVEESSSAGSDPLLTVEFSDVKLNAPLADKLFMYQPTPGAKIIDMSEMILKMMSRSSRSPANGN